uniref:Alanine--tRNA ligase n=1 Tax=Paulinella longichromatophora TaxID=1708747 RepID=A0A2H4ZP98_9EUKA|nr:alanyl-tRNA synthetase [Paulinella longichromatophora]
MASSNTYGTSSPLTGAEIREAFLDFFATRGHQRMASASLVPDDSTVLLTIAGMLPFKPIFLGQQKPPALRVTTAQKCIRTNDIENVGRTARHHTFFEMLGNFSFGDYFKEQAIRWAWELSTQVFGLDPANLVVSVFKEDIEAADIWQNVIGVNPKRIIRMDAADNFWAAGPTGPCGPCSEIYYDFTPTLGDENINLEDDTRFIEFYNLVFMESHRDANGTMTPLATKNIDTGMGLERMAQILQQKSNNYETDLIYPLIDKVAKLAQIEYFHSEEKVKASFKIIGDHSRAIVQLICDGVIASNLGRGYILRRLLRRVVRHGRLLGIQKPFLVDIGEISIQLMIQTYPQLNKRKKLILAELEREEARFLGTLERGEKLLAEILESKSQNISGEQAFELYDTYGFPLELTQEITQENGLTVDVAGFELAMKAQRQRAKEAKVNIDVTIQSVIDRIAGDINATEFCGYDVLEYPARVMAIVVDGELCQKAIMNDSVQIVLDSTPFYGESGGQVGDKGIMTGASPHREDLKILIHNVYRNRGLFVHTGTIENGVLDIGDLINAQVNYRLRRQAKAHHTATHLLQAALKKLIDPSITQAGSLVDFDHLRFDFHYSNNIPSKKLDEVETLINEWIAESHILEVSEMKLEQAKDKGAIAMFGEKYGSHVRVVNVPRLSMELCGGTHVNNTGEIGLFKITSETGIASGIRRIEAIAGTAVLPYLNERDILTKELGDQLKVPINQLINRVETLQEELKLTSKSLMLARSALVITQSMALIADVQIIGDFKILVASLDEVEASLLQTAAKQLQEKLGDNAAVLLGSKLGAGKVNFVAAFGKHIIAAGEHAGKFVGSIANICGGGGGGRPNIAQAGGRNIELFQSALNIAHEKLVLSLNPNYCK